MRWWPWNQALDHGRQRVQRQGERVAVARLGGGLGTSGGQAEFVAAKAARCAAHAVQQKVALCIGFGGHDVRPSPRQPVDEAFAHACIGQCGAFGQRISGQNGHVRAPSRCGCRAAAGPNRTA